MSAFESHTRRDRWEFVMEIQRFNPPLSYEEFNAISRLKTGAKQLHTVCEDECNGLIGNNETGRSPQRSRAEKRISNAMKALTDASGEFVANTARDWRIETQGDPRGLVLRLFYKQTLQSGIIEHEVYVGSF